MHTHAGHVDTPYQSWCIIKMLKNHLNKKSLFAIFEVFTFGQTVL